MASALSRLVQQALGVLRQAGWPALAQPQPPSIQFAWSQVSDCSSFYFSPCSCEQTAALEGKNHKHEVTAATPVIIQKQARSVDKQAAPFIIAHAKHSPDGNFSWRRPVRKNINIAALAPSSSCLGRMSFLVIYYVFRLPVERVYSLGQFVFVAQKVIDGELHTQHSFWSLF